MTPGWNEGPWASPWASDPAVTHDARQDGDEPRALARTYTFGISRPPIRCVHLRCATSCRTRRSSSPRELYIGRRKSSRDRPGRRGAWPEVAGRADRAAVRAASSYLAAGDGPGRRTLARRASAADGLSVSQPGSTAAQDAGQPRWALMQPSRDRRPSPLERLPRRRTDHVEDAAAWLLASVAL